MDKIIIIVDLLAKIGFSFWQIFGLVIIMMFRKQIIVMFERVNNIKVFGGEIGLAREQSGKVVERLEQVQNKALALPSEVGNEILEGLQSLNRELSIAALQRIRVNTTFLWPALVKVSLKKKQINLRYQSERKLSP